MGFEGKAVLTAKCLACGELVNRIYDSTQTGLTLRMMDELKKKPCSKCGAPCFLVSKETTCNDQDIIHRWFDEYEQARTMYTYLCEHLPPDAKVLLAELKQGRVPSRPHLAARDGKDEYLHDLLATGINPDLLDGNNLTPLAPAVSGGHVECVRMLLEHGANPNVNDRRGFTLLRVAAEAGNCILVKLLLKHGADPDGNKWNHGYALRAAVEGGHLDICRALIEAGASLEFDDYRVARFTIYEDRLELGDGFYDRSPMHMAAKHGHLDIVEYLLAHGDTTHTKRSATTLWEEGETLTFPIDSPLHFAALGGHTEVARLLLRAGADPNHQGRNGDVPLLYVAKKGYAEIVQMLLAAGADPNHSGARNITPLHMAVEYPNIVRLLLDAGAAPEAINEDGQSVLLCAMEADFRLFAHIIHEQKADPLDSLVGCLATIDMLLNQGVDVDVVDKKGNCALQYAIAGDDLARLRMIWERSKEENRPSGQQMLFSAAEKGNADIMTYIAEGILDQVSCDDLRKCAAKVPVADSMDEIFALLVRLHRAKGEKDEDWWSVLYHLEGRISHCRSYSIHLIEEPCRQQKALLKALGIGKSEELLLEK